VVVACVAPGSSHANESITTLKFADRARRVRKKRSNCSYRYMSWL